MPYTSSSGSSSPAQSYGETPTPPSRSAGSTPTPPPRTAGSTPIPPPSRQSDSKAETYSSPLLEDLRKIDPVVAQPGTPSRKTKGKVKAHSSTLRSKQATPDTALSNGEANASSGSGSAGAGPVRIAWKNEERAVIVAHILSEFKASSDTWEALAGKLPNRKPFDIRQQYNRNVGPHLKRVYGGEDVCDARGEEHAARGGKKQARESGGSSKKRSRRAFDKHEDGNDEGDCY